jgi:hypothetical protein
MARRGMARRGGARLGEARIFSRRGWARLGSAWSGQAGLGEDFLFAWRGRAWFFFGVVSYAFFCQILISQGSVQWQIQGERE